MGSRRARILVVDDEAAMREVLEMRLRAWGHEVAVAASGTEARTLCRRFVPDLVISDVVLPDVSGLDLLAPLREGDPDRPVLLVTAHGTIDIAVEAMKQGACDFLTKPLDHVKLQSVVEASLRERRQRAADRELAAGVSGLGALVGQSPPMRRLYQLIRLLAKNEASALLTGESGTGKELVARTLHEMSARRAGPFVALNMAAIPEGITESELFGHEKGAFTGAVSTRPGCFEMADGGTLFLDEIAEMPLALQPKLLRILEEGRVRRLASRYEVPFDVRVLAATNREPEQALREGQLRPDLYYRLNVFHVRLAPLRQRAEDVPLLAQHFLQRFNHKHGTTVDGVDGEARALLVAYPWPGNVRELRNVMERAVILAQKGRVRGSHLPPYVQRPSGPVQPHVVLPTPVTLAEAEKILILETLKGVANNKARAARQLGLDVKTIRNKLKAYGD